VKIPGEHHFAQVNCASDTPALALQVTVLPPAPGGIDPTFPVSLPFFNANESFRISVLYSGKPSQCGVTCRLPETTVQVHTLAELGRLYDSRNRRKTALTILAAMATAAAFGFGGDFLRKLFS
jgi:hypothetical protein